MKLVTFIGNRSLSLQLKYSPQNNTVFHNSKQTSIRMNALDYIFAIRVVAKILKKYFIFIRHGNIKTHTIDLVCQFLLIRCLSITNHHMAAFTKGEDVAKLPKNVKTFCLLYGTWLPAFWSISRKESKDWHCECLMGKFWNFCNYSFILSLFISFPSSRLARQQQ